MGFQRCPSCRASKSSGILKELVPEQKEQQKLTSSSKGFLGSSERLGWGFLLLLFGKRFPF